MLVRMENRVVCLLGFFGRQLVFEVLKLYVLTSSASDCTPSAMTSRTVAVRAEPKRMQQFEYFH